MADRSGSDRLRRSRFIGTAWWWLLLLIGLVGGSAYDRYEQRPPLRRAGYEVVATDLHVHTRFSDGFLSPFEVVYAARRQGLQALAVTEHNNVFPAKMARWFSQISGGPTVLIGEEVTTRDYHLIAVGIEERIRPRTDVSLTLDAIHAQGGIAIAAHPSKRYWPAYQDHLAKLDAAEVVHPVAYHSEDRVGMSWNDMVAFYEEAHAQGHQLTAIGSSDFHFFRLLGISETLIFAEDRSEAALLAALKAGRTVAIAPDGSRFGDPKLLQALEDEPLPARAAPVGYASRGILDWLARVAGFIGLMGLLLLRKAP